MGKRKRNHWLDVPWGWVLVSAYCTALVCVGVSQATSVDAALAFVKDYQTLVAGLATVAALLIAVQQLSRQRTRDAVDAVRHYEAEIDAMAELEAEIAKLMGGTTGLASMFSGIGTSAPLDRSCWERLQHQTNVSLAPAIREVIGAAEAHNQWADQLYSVPFGRFDDRQQAELRFAVHAACRELSRVIKERRREVLQLIEATS